MADTIEDSYVKVVRDLALKLSHAYENLTATQERCSSLMLENQALRADLRNRDANIRDLSAQLTSFRNAAAPLLPGWDCKGCGTFNGEAKEKRSECRACGKRAVFGVGRIVVGVEE